MRVAIDLSQIIYGTGVSHYRENLVKNLLKIDRENEYVLFGGSLRRLGELRASMENLSKGRAATKAIPISPMVGDFLWNRLHILPVEWLIGKVDVLHTSDWTEPPSKAFKVTTIHDLIPL